MDGNGGRGGGGNGGNGGNSTSGKKRATRSKTAAAQAQAQAQAQAASTASTTTGANSGGKKSTSAQASGGNNKLKAAATAEKKKKKKKNAALQSGNQQQQQQSDQPKKKKKKRRLHAGAVAAKAAAKAAEAAAGTTALSLSSPRSAAAGTTEGKPAVAMKQPPRGGQLVVTGKNVVLNAKATPAPSQSSSSAADNAAEKPKTSSLKPAKKKQKVSQQQQQQQVNARQATQETPKQQKQQHAQAQAPPVSAPVPGSVPKPKTKAKRKIAEVSTSSSSVQVATPASALKQNTLRQPAAHARVQPPSTQSVIGADAPVAKKSKMVVLKRKPAQAPSEPSSVAAADSSPAAASLVPKQVVSAPAPKQDNIPKTISLAASAASTTTTTGDGNHTVPDSAPRTNQATTPTMTTVELIEDTDDEEKATTHEAQPTTASPETQTAKSVPSLANSVQNILDVQEANSTVRKAPTMETAKLQLSSTEQAKTEASTAQREDATALEGATASEQPRALDSSDPMVAPATQAATPAPADAVQNVPVAIVQASPPLPLSPERSDLVSEWMVNASSPSTELEFEADEAFFQPRPLLTSSATEDTNVLTLPSPSDHAEEDPSPALTDSKSMKVAASPVSSSPRQPSVEMTVKEEPDEISEAPAVAKFSTDDSRQPGAEARSSTVIKPPNAQNSREFSEEETKEHEPPTTSTLPPPVPVKQAPSKSGATLAKQTEASHSVAVLRNPIVESRLRLPSKIEIPPPQPRQEANAWGASFGMATTPDRASISSSSRSSLQLLTSQTSPALATSPLSSWFLSKGHANFVQHVSFPPRSAQHHRRRSLSPRKQLSATNNTQAVQVTQKPTDEEDEDDHLGSSGNAFLESLTQRSNWRTWYGSVDKKDLLDPPLQHVPVEVRSAIDKSVHRVSESVELASSSGAADQTDDTESIERQRTKTRSIELLEAEIRAEKARARAFDQELLRMLQSGSTLPSQM